jgi:hypothetical protein
MAAHFWSTNTIFKPAMPKCSLKPLRFTKEDYVREYNETSTERFQAFKASFTIVDEPLNVTEEQPHQLRNRIAKDWRIRRLLFFKENEEQRQERELHELDLQINALRKQLKRACISST